MFFKKILSLVLISILVLLVILITRTLLLTPPKNDISDIETAEINEKQALNKLSQAIRFETIYQASAEEDEPSKTKVFDLFHEFLFKSFPLVHKHLQKTNINKYSLLYRWEGTNKNTPPLIILAHQDVVPALKESLNSWQHPPFSGKIADGFIWGRGTLDDKSSLIATMEAIEYLLSKNFTPKKTIYFALGHDEETGGNNGAKAIAAALKKQGVSSSIVLDEGGFILQNVVPGVSEPIGLVGIAEKGYMSLKLTAKGKEGHSSMPPKQTAVGIIASAISKLEKNPYTSRYEGATKLLFNEINPYMEFKEKFIFANIWLFDPLILSLLEKKPTTNATIRSTFAATIVRGGEIENVLPSQATATINIRLMPGDSSADIIKYVEATVADQRVTLKSIHTPNEASSMSSITSSEYRLLKKTTNQHFKKNKIIVAPFLTINGTDSKHYSDIAKNTYRFRPILLKSTDISKIHGINERISIDNYIRMIKFYVSLISQF